MAICKTCGASFEGNFCSNCGAKKEESVQMFCTACGAPLVPDARFCGRCGYDRKAAPVEPVTVAAPVVPVQEAPVVAPVAQVAVSPKIVTPVVTEETAQPVVPAAQDYLSAQRKESVATESESKNEEEIFTDEILTAFGYTEERVKPLQETGQAAVEESTANETQTSSSAKNSKALRNGKKAFRIGVVCAAAVVALVVILSVVLGGGEKSGLGASKDKANAQVIGGTQTYYAEEERLIGEGELLPGGNNPADLARMKLTVDGDDIVYSHFGKDYRGHRKSPGSQTIVWDDPVGFMDGGELMMTQMLEISIDDDFVGYDLNFTYSYSGAHVVHQITFRKGANEVVDNSVDDDEAFAILDEVFSSLDGNYKVLGSSRADSLNVPFYDWYDVPIARAILLVFFLLELDDIQYDAANFSLEPVYIGWNEAEELIEIAVEYDSDQLISVRYWPEEQRAKYATTKLLIDLDSYMYARQCLGDIDEYTNIPLEDITDALNTLE